MSFVLSFNRNVARDLRDTLAFYEEQSGSSLADAFYDELMLRVDQVRNNPKWFPFSKGDRRRVNLDRFPYHFLYRFKSENIRILVLRHNQRNPKYGDGRR